jgi:hypothetical protein
MRGIFQICQEEFSLLGDISKERVIIHTSNSSNSEYLVDDHPDWKNINLDAEEEIPNDLALSKGTKVRTTV